MHVAVFLITAVIAAVISSSAYGFGPLCCSNPTNEIRGSDVHGSGAYRPPRRNKKHKGVDIKCEDGSKVYAPLDMKILSQSKPFPKNNKINNGIDFEAEGKKFKLWYIQPEKTSGTVKKGEVIGTMLPMQQVYKGITSHVHFQRYKKNPLSMINTQNKQENRNFCSDKNSVASEWGVVFNDRNYRKQGRIHK